MGALLCALLLLQAAPVAQSVRQAADATSLVAIGGDTGNAAVTAHAAPQLAARHFDPAASRASFIVHTRWLSAIAGRFDAPTGALETLPDGQVQVEVSLTAASVTFPGSARTTRWTRSDAFFDVDHYPVIRFRSEAFPRARLGAGGALDGMLELRGVSKPVRFVLAKSTCAQPGVACPIHAAGRVSRSAFGMTRMLLLVRDNVEFAFDARLEASR